jgi:acyl-CoA synthetase (AMP-forming)/AMP-acid ligase II
MLLSEMTFNAVPWHVLAGWVLSALALWAAGITVVRRRRWSAKAGGGLLLIGATVVSLLVAVLLVLAPLSCQPGKAQW